MRPIMLECEDNQKTFPLVSILVPAYNHANYIKHCLDSVIEDNYPNKELIIINDGSNDNTHNIITEWIELNNKYLYVFYRYRENLGVSATLNELISESHGDYLCPVASDDYILPGGINKRMEYLQRHPNKCAVIGDCIVVDEYNQIKFSSILSQLYHANKIRYFNDNGLKYEIITNWSLGGPTLLLSRDAFNKVGFFDTELHIEDWDFFLRLAANDCLGYIDEAVSAYRLHSNNTCKTRSNIVRIKHQENKFTSLERAIALYHQPFKSLLEAEKYLVSAKLCFIKNNLLSSIIYVIRYLIISMIGRVKYIKYVRDSK